VLLIWVAVLQILQKVSGERERLFRYAVNPKRFSTNFACPAGSPPSNLLTYPFLIMCAASISSIVCSVV
jgi:hypothetical protein